MNWIHSHLTNAKLDKEQMEYKETPFGGLPLLQVAY